MGVIIITCKIGPEVNWKGVGFGNLGFCIIMRLICFGQQRHASQTFSLCLKDIIGIEAEIWPLPKFDFRIVHLQTIFKTKNFNFQALIHFESKCICTSKDQILCRIGDLFYSYLICFTFWTPQVLAGFYEGRFCNTTSLNLWIAVIEHLSTQKVLFMW